MINNSSLNELQVLAVKLLMAEKNTMCEVYFDPVKQLGIQGMAPGAGKMMVVIASGASIDELKTAIKLAKNPQ